MFFALLLAVPPDPDSFLDPDFGPRSASTFSDRLQMASLGRDVVRSPSSKDRKAIVNPQYDPPAALLCPISALLTARVAIPALAIPCGERPSPVASSFDPRGPPAFVI
ncbi:hypothetical protein [Rhizobium sp.]